MKREELKKLNLADDVIEQLMTMYGKDIQAIQSENEQLKVANVTKEKSIAEANKTIEGFKGLNVDEIKKQADEYKTKYEASKGEFEKTLIDTKKKYAIEIEVGKLKVKNPNTIKKLLEQDKITFDGEKLVGFEEQIKGLKESDNYLFEEVQQQQRRFGGENNLPNSTALSAEDEQIRAVMGLGKPKK